MTDAELEAEIRHILALAAEATPGPWACSDNVEQIFGVKHWDWWEIYAKNPDMDSRVPIRVLARMSSHWCTKEEELEARAAYFAGKKHPDPGESGKNARFIAGVNPAVIQRIMNAMLLRLSEKSKP
ncbi:MAG: hypothetical protein E7022_00005 [Desulfovibrio desulfuricans]|nr:hypothetical protein [Desulfovibrio desulfuricans]